MAIDQASYLKTFHDASVAAGRKAINSDFTIQIAGFENMWFLTKQCPWPILSSAGEIEVPGPIGSMEWEMQQTKTALQGPIAFYETVAGSADQALVNIIANGGRFDAKVFHGTPTKYIQAKRIADCGLVMDQADCDFENRSQVLLFSGTLFYHYFGEIIPGNSATI